MSTILFVESLKFYKMKNERFLRLVFFGLFLFNLGFLLLPIGDRNLLPFFLQLSLFAENQIPAERVLASLSFGNALFLLSRLALFCIDLLAAHLFALSLIAECLLRPPLSGLTEGLKTLYRVLPFGLASIFLFSFSGVIFFIPFILFNLFFFFAPVILSREKLPWLKSWRLALDSSKGHRLAIFLTADFVILFYVWAERVFARLGERNELASALMSALSATLFFLILGRMQALLYLFFRIHLPGRPSVLMSDPRQMFERIDAGKALGEWEEPNEAEKALEREMQNFFPKLYEKLKAEKEREDALLRERRATLLEEEQKRRGEEENPSEAREKQAAEQDSPRDAKASE